MAVNLFNEYPQNTQAPNEDYPFGAFRNRTAPTATDGTTLEEKWSNDWQAFFSRLFIEASMTPSGEVDTVKVSQYYDALLSIIQREKVEVSNSLNGTRTDVAASEDALRRTHELASSKVSKSGDTMTGSLVTQDSLRLRDIVIPQNNVGSQFQIENEAGNMIFRRGRSDGNASGEQRIAMPNKSGTVALLTDGLGVAQTWQDMTSQRVAGTTYTNNTGKPIFFSLWSRQAFIGSKAMSVYVDGLEVAYADSGSASDLSVTLIIPPGSTYRVKLSSLTLNSTAFWYELR